MNNQKHCIAIDIGGTSVKSAIVLDNGVIFEQTVNQTPVNAKANAEEILSAFVTPITELLEIAKSNQLKIAGIGIGMPGPLDMKNGISLIKGVDKYESIYGVNLKNEFRQRLNLAADFPICFEVDAWTFVRGEAWQGAAQGLDRIIGITLGTGFGSGFMVNDDIVDSGPGVPDWAWIGGLPYQDGIYDDRISKRGIIARYRKLIGDVGMQIDVKDIALKASEGDGFATTVFEETGAILGESIMQVAPDFKPECVVVGGQIAHSFDLFAKPLHQKLTKLPFLKKITKAAHIEQSAVLGASKLLFESISTNRD